MGKEIKSLIHSSQLAGISESDVYMALSCLLKEVTSQQGHSHNGEADGSAGITYESSAIASAVKDLLEGKPFRRKGVGRMFFSRHDSDPAGYMHVRGLPWDVTSDEVSVIQGRIFSS